MAQRTARRRAPAAQEAGKSHGRWNRETHVRHRDYSPTLGRFIEPDPIGFDAGDDNWYRFVANGPTIGVDPTGLDRFLVISATGHQYLVVEIWDKDTNGRPFVKGYMRLDYSVLGFSCGPADYASRAGTYLSNHGPGTENAVVRYRYTSSMAQDQALLLAWFEMSSYTWNLSYPLGYVVGVNCTTVSTFWAQYGGAAGQAADPIPFAED